jgi:hypothetical protein
MNGSLPGDEMIVPLKPKLWRTGTLAKEIRPRVDEFGSRFTLVCSDMWGYDANKAPYLMYPAYEERMRQIARAGGERNDIYDIWNEPNGKEFWNGTSQQFLETFKRGHDAIRSVRPDAVIAGPSMAGYDHRALTQFLDYCLAHKIKLNVLTWHEFRAGLGLSRIESSLKQARADFLQNPKYRPLGIKEIHINESINSTVQFAPASILAVLDRLERGGADAAGRACWNESTGTNSCWNNTLDGLLTPQTRHPRAAWWAYKAYADGADERVASTTNNGRTFALASTVRHQDRGSTTTAQVILGTYGINGLPAPPVRANLILNHLSAVPYLRGRKEVTLSITRIPNTGEAPLTSLAAPEMYRLPVIADSVQINLNLPVEEACVIKLIL